MTTFELLRGVHSTERMDEGVVTSERCWSGIQEMMPEISKRIELVEKWTCHNVLEKKLFLNDSKILTEENSWRTWKSNQNIVMDEELVQNVVVDEELVQNIVMDEDVVLNVVMDEKFVKNFVMDEELVRNIVMDEELIQNVVTDEE